MQAFFFFTARRVLAAAVVGLLLGFAGGVPRLAAASRDIQQYTLDNGLTVILAPLPAARRVAVVVRYNVGSADEQKGRSGFAHLFEHLMFEGTAAIPDYDAEATAAGAEQNAFTEWDATTYYINGGAPYLPKFLRLEADRMANLANAVTQQDLDNQRDIIGNELRQRTLDEPGIAALRQGQAELVDKAHPYGHSTIGSMADLAAATLDDVRAFHRTYYVPSNAIVTIAGGIDVAQAKDLVARTFGLVPSAPRPAPVAAAMAPHDTRRVDATDAVEQPTVTFAWQGPRAASDEDYGLAVLSLALSSDAGPLYLDLVDKQHLATAAWAGWDSRRLGGLFSIGAKAAQGVSAATLEGALKASWARIGVQGLSAEHLHATAQSLAADYDTIEADPTYYAFMLGSAAAETGAAANYRHLLDVAEALTPARASAALGPLQRAPEVITTVSPGPRNKRLPPVLTESTGTAAALPFTARPDVAIPDLPALAATTASVPEGQTVRLANGIPVTVYPAPDESGATITVLLPVGSTATAGDTLGLIDLTLKLDMHGAGDMTREVFSRTLETAGARLTRFLTNHAAAISISAPAASLDTAAQLLATAIRAPRFTQADWDFTVAQSAQRVAEWRSQPDVVAGIAAAAAAYPPGAPEGAERTAEIIRGLRMADAEKLHAALFAPAAMKLQVVTRLAPAAVKAVLDRSFAGWAPLAGAVVAPPPALPRFAGQEVTRDVPGATQAAVLLDFAAPGGASREAVAFEIAMQVFAGGSSNRLNKMIREEKGWSYGISGGVDNGEKPLGNGSAYVFATIEAGHVRDALGEIQRLRSGLAVQPISAEEFNGARLELRNMALSSLETSANLSATMAGLAMQGYAPGDLAQRLALYDSVTLDEVRQQAARIAAAPALTVIAGDHSKIR